MHGDMVRFVAFDLILRFIWAGVMCMSLVIDGLGVDLDNPAADLPRFGIPRNVVADSELFFHFMAFSSILMPNRTGRVGPSTAGGNLQCLLTSGICPLTLPSQMCDYAFS